MLPAVLRTERQFALLFSSQVLSLLGDRVMLIALPFAALSAGGDASAVGLVMAAQFAPFLVFGLVGGVVADRAERKHVLIASDAVRLACQLGAGLLLVAGEATPALLAALAFPYGAADAFFQPALVGLVPRTLSGADQLQAANAVRGLADSVTTTAGPVLAGVLIAAVGPGGALLFDAGTFAASIALLLPLRPRAVAAATEAPPAAAPSVLGEIRAGWREVRSRRWVWTFLLAMAGYHAIVLPAVFVLGPVLADRELGGAGSWAAIVAAFGAGAVLGQLVLLRWRPRHALRVAAACLVVAGAQAAFIGSGLGTAGIALLEAAAGMGVTGFFTLWETSLQEHVPDGVLSRVSSYDYMVSVGLIPVGTAVAGPLSEAIGLQPTLLGMGALGVATGLALLAVRAVRDLPRGAVAA